MMKTPSSIMKYVFHTFIILAAFTSCGTDDNGNGTDEDIALEFIRATVENLDFESSNEPNGVTATKIEGDNSTIYLVQGFDTAGNAIVLTISNYDGEGTYSLNFDEDTVGTLGQYSDQNTAWSTVGDNGGSGSITVITDDMEETSGRFEFTGVEIDGGTSTKQVRNGSFRARF